MHFKNFSYLDYQTEVISDSLIVKFNYSLDQHQFQEEICFPNISLKQLDLSELATSLAYLHLILGISYYKVGVPDEITLHNYWLSTAQAEFFNQTFFLGLQEFAYRNQLDLRDKINFPVALETNLKASNNHSLSGIILPMGGGKDSMLCLEILKAEKPLLLTLGVNPQVQAIAELMNLPLVEITRKIDPKLLLLNEQGGLNGHVPFSAILGAVCVVAGLIYQKKYLVLGNERSANEANLEYLGTAVNHQYSKSFHFEERFNNFIKTQINGELEYFSLLRQFSEAGIARQLAKHHEYLDIFASCNQFKKLSSDRTRKWCGRCAKCCFVFLCMAPFVDQHKMFQIFGANLLAAEDLLLEFQRLTGLAEDKPWECVGEYSECRELFRLLIKEKKYHTSFIVQKITEQISAESELDLFSLQGEDLIPKKFKIILDEYLRVN